MWPTPLPLTHNAIHLPIHPSIHLLRISTPRIWILWRPLQEPQGKLVSIFNLLVKHPDHKNRTHRRSGGRGGRGWSTHHSLPGIQTGNLSSTIRPRAELNCTLRKTEVCFHIEKVSPSQSFSNLVFERPFQIVFIWRGQKPTLLLVHHSFLCLFFFSAPTSTSSLVIKDQSGVTAVDQHQLLTVRWPCSTWSRIQTKRRTRCWRCVCFHALFPRTAIYSEREGGRKWS